MTLSDRPTFTTRAVRAGLESDEVTGAVVPPLHLSSNFAFRGYGDKRKYDYSRSGNPTRDLLGDALADLEGGYGGIITSSGMSAIAVVGHLLPQATLFEISSLYGHDAFLKEAGQLRPILGRLFESAP